MFFSKVCIDCRKYQKVWKYAVKQAQQSIWHSTPDIHLYVVVVVSGFRSECFLPNSFLLFREKQKEVENEEKNIDSVQKKLKRM